MSGTLGIDVGGTNTKLVYLDDTGRRALDSLPTRGELGPEDYFARLATRIAAEGLPIHGLGLAFAGLVGLDGRVVQAPNLSRFEGHHPAEWLSQWLPGIPVEVDNDVNAMLRGEHRFGAARGVRDVLMLGLGTGVGGALLLDGRIYRGSTGLAGELGHTLLDHDGPLCACGLKGHVEAYLSTRAIGEFARDKMAAAPPEQRAALAAAAAGSLPTPRVLSELGHAGDALSIAILAELGRVLGCACGNLVNAFNPELVVVGGGVAGCGDLLLEPARRELVARAMAGPGAVVRLVTTELGSDGAALGVAALARDALDGNLRGGDDSRVG